MRGEADTRIKASPLSDSLLVSLPLISIPLLERKAERDFRGGGEVPLLPSPYRKYPHLRMCKRAKPLSPLSLPKNVSFLGCLRGASAPLFKIFPPLLDKERGTQGVRSPYRGKGSGG